MTCVCFAITMHDFVHEAHAQEKAPKIHIPEKEKKPLKPERMLAQRMNKQIRLSLLPKWTKVSVTADQSDGSRKLIETKERDLVVRLLRLTGEETRILDEAFAIRGKEREVSIAPLATLISQEAMELLAYERGETPRLDTSAYLLSPPGKIDKLFEVFIKEENASEKKLVEAIQEQFDPTQRSELFKRWIGLNDLHILFSQSHLQLTDEQTESIRLAIEKFEETQSGWKKSAIGSDSCDEFFVKGKH